MSALRPRLIPYLVLGVSLGITALVAWYVWAAANAKDQARFENQVERNQLSIHQRLDTYVNALRGVAGLYAARKNIVTLVEFREYVERLGIAERYPGIQGIGVSAMAHQKDLTAMVEVMRKQGIADFHVRPAGARDVYYPIFYLEPLDERNRTALGYDMYTDPTRRAAMDLAQDSGNAATSGKVTLVQEITDAKQAGFLIYVPAYYTVTIPPTREERHQKLGGFIYAPFRAEDFLSGIFGTQQYPLGIAFAVYDGDRTDPEALLYRSDRAAPDAAPSGRFVNKRRLPVPGREWTVVYASGPLFETSSSRNIAVLVLTAGGVVSVLLFSLTAAQAEAQKRAEESAQELLRGEQEIRAAKEAAETALVEAQRASELKDEFLATISHELRTPLNAILGWSQLLYRTPNLGTEELQHGLETIERSARAQARLIEDLLDVSRVVAGKLQLEVRVVQLGPVVEAAIASVQLAADAKGVRLERELDPTVGAVSGDATRLGQIVWNLLSNAVKFTSSGGSVRIALRREGAAAQIVVSDTGIGISGDFLPHVFERFRQADASTTRRYGGLGLGLGIVRHLTELHGGTVHAHSNGADQGSTFTVTLPLASGAAPRVSEAAPKQAPSLAGMNVLLVEDDAAARELIARVLSDHGARVTSRSSVKDAMAVLGENRPDVIVSDIGMPDEDGYSLIAQIREMSGDNGTAIPAVALTALARAEDRERALKAGFAAHIAKPFEPEELSTVISQLVNKPQVG